MKYLGTRTAATDDVAVQNDLSGLLSATTAANTYALKSHTHTKSQITDLAVATTSAAGLLSAADKTKLDGIAAGANKYVLPTNVTAEKFINSSYNSANYFLMGNGTVTTKKNLTSVSHCGWTGNDTDALLVPTMNTIAYWNGAYNSSGSSNLAYCNKGAFGTFATKSSLAFSELTSKPTTLAGYGITDGARNVSWSCTVRCATWSRLCYVNAASIVIGCSFLINVSGTRGNVVYNDTFAIKAHHLAFGSISKISGSKYGSFFQIRTIVDNSGNCYVELYDDVRGATSSTTQSVKCSLIPIFTGDIVTYTSFVDGTTAPSGFGIAASMTTNTNSLQGNLTWDEITSRPTTISGYGITDGMKALGRFPGNIDSQQTNGSCYISDSATGTLPAGYAFRYVEMLTLKNRDTIGQLVIPYGDNDIYGGGSLWFRGGHTNGTWRVPWRRCLDDNNYSSYALPLTGGTLTGSMTMRGLETPIIRDFSHNTGAFARDIISLYQDGTATTQVGRIGYWGIPTDTYNFIYIGANTYNGDNLRVYSDHVSWGNNTIYHSGNSNLSTVNWTCATLTASAATISGLLTATSLSISGAASVGSLKIGDATITWDSTTNALKVDKNFYSTGTVASGV